MVCLLHCFALLCLVSEPENMFVDLLVVSRAVSHAIVGPRAVSHAMVGPRTISHVMVEPRACSGRAARRVTCSGQAARGVTCNSRAFTLVCIAVLLLCFCVPLLCIALLRSAEAAYRCFALFCAALFFGVLLFLCFALHINHGAGNTCCCARGLSCRSLLL